jgi:biotin carboxyl carrier protein
MKWRLRVGGKAVEIEILAPAPECRFRRDGAGERAASVEPVEPNVYSVLLDGRSYEARIEPAPGLLIVVVNGHRFEIAVDDPRAWRTGGERVAAGGVATVSAPMPGKIVRVMVERGDVVVAGQGLVVVEAMKMQNEMKAPRAGRVASLAAREGDTVAAGDPLATIVDET